MNGPGATGDKPQIAVDKLVALIQVHILQTGYGMITEDQPLGISKLAVDKLIGPDGIDRRLPGPEEPGYLLPPIRTALTADPGGELYNIETIGSRVLPQQRVVVIRILIPGVVE